MSHRNPLPPFLKEYIQEGEITDQGLDWFNLVRSHSSDLVRKTFTWNPASLAAQTHVEETVTITGLKTVDDVLAIIKPTFTQGFQVGQGRVSAANTLSIQVVNGTSSSSNPNEESYILIYMKNSRN